MLVDNKGPKSPPKGKTKEEVNWNTGWWDFHPLVERLSPRRVEWSNSSTIFSPHATEARVLARHFSSSKKFTIPSPASILNAPTAYDPPTVISVSSDDQWLFAYFPGKEGDGSACLWNRGAEIDNWLVKEFWSTAPGAGFVTVAWLGGPREWGVAPDGTFCRLPPFGPQTPVSKPTLLLVAQNHRATLCYMRNYLPTLKMVSVSLTVADSANEMQPTPDFESDNVNVLSICSSAAIGLDCGESSILVATRSHVLPYPPPNTSNDHFNAMDISLPLDFEQSVLESTRSDDPCGEDAVINLTEIKLRFNSSIMNISTIPLAPIPTAKTGLSYLGFVSHPSASEEPTSTLHLLASFLDFGDYTSTPCSTITCYPFSYDDENGITSWKSNDHSSTKCLGFLSRRDFTWDGYTPGYIRHLGPLYWALEWTEKFRPELTDDETCQASPILTTGKKVGREVPLAVAMSPNEALICTLSSNLFTSQVSVHASPNPPRGDSELPLLSTSLASAILSRRSTADLVHVLSLPSIPLDEVVDLLDHTLKFIGSELQPYIPHSVLIWPTMGVTLEVYRLRSLRVTDEGEKERLTARWQMMHETCSLEACNSAFDHCRDADGPDLLAVWQFTGLCTWIINFIEKVLKETMLRSSNRPPKADSDIDLFGADPELSPSSTTEQAQHYSPYLLLIIHSELLECMKKGLSNVRKFRTRLESLAVKGENAEIAKQVVVDLVSCAAVDLDALEPIIDTFIEQSNALSEADQLRSLAACEPTISMHAQLEANIHRLCDSGVMSKSRLYIKPSELIDGFENLSLEKSELGSDKDIISKGQLLKRPQYVQCLRCNGRSEVALPVVAGQTNSLRWRAWEKQWVPICICGGSWVKGSV